jgi:hypothetical protein
VGNNSHIVFGHKFPGEKGSVRHATTNSFVAKVQGEVFAHFHELTTKHHSSMQNWLFGLLGQILCEQSA